MRVVGSVSASQCIYRTQEDHTCVGHRGHVKPVLEVSWFYFPAVLMTRLNVTFPFGQILTIGMIKAQPLWILLRNFIAGTYVFSQRTEEKSTCMMYLFLSFYFQPISFLMFKLQLFFLKKDLSCHITGTWIGNYKSAHKAKLRLRWLLSLNSIKYLKKK